MAAILGSVISGCEDQRNGVAIKPILEVSAA
jgi:hypothetical protein